MKKIRVVVLGSGNIGSDLTERLLRDEDFEVFGVVGRNESSLGLQRFRGRVQLVSHTGITGLEPHLDLVDGFFDATSAQSAPENWKFAQNHNKWLIDLTPSKLGSFFVPSISGLAKTIALSPVRSHNYSMVTCGGQSAAPIIHAMLSKMESIEDVEVSSSIAAKSAGIATRDNIDQYVETTEQLIESITGCQSCKAILVLNPSTPAVPMRTTVTVRGLSHDLKGLNESVHSMAQLMKSHNPGYELVSDLVRVDPETFSVTIRVTGAGYFLPSYAGNLDIINSAAVLSAKMHARQFETESLND